MGDLFNAYVTGLTVRKADGTEARYKGREAWALYELILAGERGCTPINNPAPRWSHYVFLLRRHGLNVETIDESHGGPFAGSHARYVLRSKLQVISTDRSGQNRRAAA